jgi:hypothetical protein
MTAPIPTDDLALWLQTPSTHEAWHHDDLAETLELISQRRLTAEQLAALAAARLRLAELQAAARAMDAAALALSRHLLRAG